MVRGLFLGRWSGVGPWFGGFGGCPSWGCFSFYFLRGGVSRPRGPASPLCGRVCFVFLIHFLALVRFGLLSKKKDVYILDVYIVHLCQLQFISITKYFGNDFIVFVMLQSHAKAQCIWQDQQGRFKWVSTKMASPYTDTRRELIASGVCISVTNAKNLSLAFRHIATSYDNLDCINGTRCNCLWMVS